MVIKFVNVPCHNFKIRKKEDAETFVKTAMAEKIEYSFITSDDTAYFIQKENGICSVRVKYGNLYNPFNPMIEIANTSNNSYDKTVYDFVWKLRKYINKEWFNNY